VCGGFGGGGRGGGFVRVLGGVEWLLLSLRKPMESESSRKTSFPGIISCNVNGEVEGLKKALLFHGEGHSEGRVLPPNCGIRNG